MNVILHKNSESSRLHSLAKQAFLLRLRVIILKVEQVLCAFCIFMREPWEVALRLWTL